MKVENMPRPVLLAILDGLGLGKESESNAFYQAKTPNLDALMSTDYRHLIASGEAVGLPEGQMGNSEVGHLNLGAGRVVDQDLNRITKAILDGSLSKNKTLNDLVNHVKESSGALHLMGLVSEGGVHSHLNHLYGLLEICKDLGLKEVYVHAIMDGRDVSPTVGVKDIEKLQEKMDDIGIGKLASIIGRYYAMDRDKRWDRTKIAYDLYTLGIGIPTTDPLEEIAKSYDLGTTDEFLYPYVLIEDNEPVGRLEDGDGLLFFNFRPDRARQIIQSFVDDEFEHFTRLVRPNIYVTTMTHYDEFVDSDRVLFLKENIEETLGEVISKHGLHQLRIAETEKYPHVTFFFNGGREEPYENEDRILVPSPKVATYDLQPEMSAREVTRQLLEQIEKDKYDLIILNFANPDMVGHTGDMAAAIKAVETVDECLGSILKAVTERGGIALVTADHGNCEEMKAEDGGPLTSHTTNPVPLLIVGDEVELKDGKLCDIAPTILKLMDIEQPEKMTGRSLIKE